MKTTKIFKAVLLSLLLSNSISYADYSASTSAGEHSVSNPPHAQAGYSTSSGKNQITYHSIASAPIAEYYTPQNIPNDTFYTQKHRHPYPQPGWMQLRANIGYPEDLVVGGHENRHELFICRSAYRGGMHPGKLLPEGRCHISFGGEEVILNHFQVLVSHRHLRFVPMQYGRIPQRAIVGGGENNGSTLFICNAHYRGTLQIGKVVGNNCNIAFGGKEIAISRYKVLVR